MATIEEEIKQKKFANEFQKLAVNILFTSSWVSGRINTILKPHEISVQQYNILRILRGQYPNPAPLKLLTDRMIDKMSNTSRLIDKLMKKKLVERKICADNRRQVDIRITEAGLTLLENLTVLIEEKNMKIGIKENDAQLLNQLLDKLRSEN